jgi:hypothetical protein
MPKIHGKMPEINGKCRKLTEKGQNLPENAGKIHGKKPIWEKGPGLDGTRRPKCLNESPAWTKS